MLQVIYQNYHDASTYGCTPTHILPFFGRVQLSLNVAVISLAIQTHPSGAYHSLEIAQMNMS
jgi:hypothetical protein